MTQTSAAPASRKESPLLPVFVAVLTAVVLAVLVQQASVLNESQQGEVAGQNRVAHPAPVSSSHVNAAISGDQQKAEAATATRAREEKAKDASSDVKTKGWRRKRRAAREGSVLAKNKDTQQNTLVGQSQESPREDVTVIAKRMQKQPGRTGHFLKDLASAVILATLNGWRLDRPTGFDEPLGKLFLLDKIADETPSSCSEQPRQVQFDETRWDGFLDFSDFEAYMKEKDMPSKRKQRGGMCISVELSWRIHMHQLYAWEMQERVKPGTYEAALDRLRRALPVTNTSHPYWEEGDGRLHFVVHQRRGDISEQQSVLRVFKRAVAYISRTQHSTQPIAVTFVTEKWHSHDVFKKACRFQRLPPHVASCQVKSGTLQQDFAAMLSADILLVSSSSLSTWASILGRQQAVYWMPYIDYRAHPVLGKQYFAPCEHPDRFHCLDVVGSEGNVTTFTRCPCKGHRERVTELMHAHVKRREEQQRAAGEQQQDGKERGRRNRRRDGRDRDKRWQNGGQGREQSGGGGVGGGGGQRRVSGDDLEADLNLTGKRL